MGILAAPMPATLGMAVMATGMRAVVDSMAAVATAVDTGKQMLARTPKRLAACQPFFFELRILLT
jgi:hypothetical protein